jgi:hypothetical protein
VRELQIRIVAKLERDDRPYAGAPDSVSNAYELASIEAGRLLEYKMLPCVCRADCLIGVQVVGRCD